MGIPDNENINENIPEGEPTLRPIKGGWAASGDGWAVHGATQEEAVERFYVAVRQHCEIARRPYWCQVLQADVSGKKKQPDA